MIPREQLLYNFRLAQLRLEAAKANEMRWRMLVASTFDNVQRGTNTSKDGLVKLVSKVNVNIDSDRDRVRLAINEFYRLYPDTSLETVIDWTYKISGSAFIELLPEHQIALSGIVTITPATPTVSIVE